MLCKDGSWKWILGRGIVASRSSDGKPLRLVGTNTDITERKKAALALAESESRFREIFDAINDAIFIHDAETGRILNVNRRMCELYDLTLEQALVCGPDDLSAGTSPYSAADAAEKFRLTLSGSPQTFDWLARAHDGHLFWVEVSLRLALIGNQQQILAVVRDVSERKQVDAKLLESENRLRTIIENEPECIKIIDAQG